MGTSGGRAGSWPTTIPIPCLCLVDRARARAPIPVPDLDFDRDPYRGHDGVVMVVCAHAPIVAAGVVRWAQKVDWLFPAQMHVVARGHAMTRSVGHHRDVEVISEVEVERGAVR